MFDKLHLSSARNKASKAAPAATQQVATAGQAAASGGQIGVTAGNAAGIVDKAVVVKLAVIAVIGSAVAGGVVYRTAQPFAAPEPSSLSASIAQKPPIPAQTDPRVDPPAPSPVASPATAAMRSEDILNTYLLQMLSDASDQVRLVAVHALSTSRDPHAVTALVIALTKDVEPTVRREAALALGELLDERTADGPRELGLHALATAAESDPDMDVCVAAGSALARRSHKQARPRAPAQ
jgi:hypothetical protein